MNSEKNHRYSAADGTINIWIEQKSSIQLKAISSFGDPVELNATEARVLAAQLQEFADLLDRFDG